MRWKKISEFLPNNAQRITLLVMHQHTRTKLKDKLPVSNKAWIAIHQVKISKLKAMMCGWRLPDHSGVWTNSK